MTTKHTPGPWRIEWHDGESHSTEILPTTNPNAIAHVFATDICDVARADARLIAASPDLLEVCKTIFDGIHKGRIVLENNGQVLVLKQAIAKAEGRE